MTAHPSPGVYTKIIDLSSYLQDIPGSTGFVPIISKTGPDNQLVYKSSTEDFLKTFGNPNINEFGKQYGMGKYIAWQHMSVSPSLYCIRCLPSPGMQNSKTGEFLQSAEYSNIMVGYVIDRSAQNIVSGGSWNDAYNDEISGGSFSSEYNATLDGGSFAETSSGGSGDTANLVLSPAVKFADNLYDTDSIATALTKDYIYDIDSDEETTNDQKQFYPLFIAYPIGRGDEYNNFGIKMYPSKNTEDVGIYVIEIWKNLTGSGDSNIESFYVSFDKNAVNNEGDSIFIETVVNSYSQNVRISVNENNVDYFLNNIPETTDVTQDVSVIKNIKIYDADDYGKNVEAGTVEVSCFDSSISSVVQVGSKITISGCTTLTPLNGTFILSKVVNSDTGALMYFQYPGYGPTNSTLPATLTESGSIDIPVTSIIVYPTAFDEIEKGTCVATVSGSIPDDATVGTDIHITGTDNLNGSYKITKVNLTTIEFMYGDSSTTIYPDSETSLSNAKIQIEKTIKATTTFKVHVKKEIINISETRTYTSSGDVEYGMPIHFQNGSLGDLVDANGNLNATVAKQLLIQAYKGILDEKVKDIDGIYIPIVYDAGYPADVKVSAMELQYNYRNDGVVIGDIGDNKNTESALRNRVNPQSSEENVISSMNTYYMAIFDPYSKIFDSWTGKDIWVTPVYHMAQLIPTNDKLYELWYPSAGFNRGSVTSIKQLRYNCNQTDRDNFYLNQINPIVQFSIGNTVWGNLTTQRKPSALQDLSIIRMVLYIKRALEQYCKYYIFEFNDEQTWQSIKNDIDPFLEQIKKARGLEEYSTEVGATDYEKKQKVCHVNVTLKPTRCIERIELNLSIV